MGVMVKFIFKAPKLVKVLKDLGIGVAAGKKIFTEKSSFSLPSGACACVFDEDAWGYTLYGPQEMGLPRCLYGINSGDSFARWLFSLLGDIGDDEQECDESGNGSAFCREFKDITEKKFSREEIEKLDALIKDAEILYLSYWGGTDFDYTYATIKNGKMKYWAGAGSDDEEVYKDWHWNDLNGFIKLVKKNIPATTYKRKKGKWIEI